MEQQPSHLEVCLHRVCPRGCHRTPAAPVVVSFDLEAPRLAGMTHKDANPPQYQLQSKARFLTARLLCLAAPMPGDTGNPRGRCPAQVLPPTTELAAGAERPVWGKGGGQGLVQRAAWRRMMQLAYPHGQERQSALGTRLG